MKAKVNERKRFGMISERSSFAYIKKLKNRTLKSESVFADDAVCRGVYAVCVCVFVSAINKYDLV